MNYPEAEPRGITSLNAMLLNVFRRRASGYFLRINFRNILDSRVEEQIITGENYSLKSKGKRYGRRFSTTFVYRFNREKNDRDRMPGS